MTDIDAKVIGDCEIDYGILLNSVFYDPNTQESEFVFSAPRNPTRVLINGVCYYQEMTSAGTRSAPSRDLSRSYEKATDMTKPYSETAKNWHIMITTRGGKVSMLQNLDAPTARAAFKKLRPHGRPRKYINQSERLERHVSTSFELHQVRDSDIESVYILGPENADLDPWRGVEPIIIYLAAKRGSS